MKVLIIGGGGREHALAWKVAQSSKVSQVFVAPGNAGTAHEAKVENIPIAAEDVQALLDFASAKAIELTIVGPEAPLVVGISDAFQAAGLRCFGPSMGAAQLEGSKAFTKEFLERYAIPSARYASFTEIEPALDYIRSHGVPIVVKADGLAAGKGVVVAQTLEEAEHAVRSMLGEHCFGPAGQRVVIEEFLHGEEASFICLVSGEHVLALATSQDHKAREAGDQGPNTGGMGAYSPAPVITPALHDRIMQEVMLPTVRGMANEGHPYTGFLYAGLMIDGDGVAKVLEFNCRLGDPEAQPVLMRLQTDLVQLCEAALDGRLHHVKAAWDSRPALGVVLVAEGYPGAYRKGDEITLPTTEADETKIFHAGTAEQEGHIITQGGRVLCACALGENIQAAQHLAYQVVHRIHWQGMGFREDIGHRALAREQKESVQGK